MCETYANIIIFYTRPLRIYRPWYPLVPETILTRISKTVYNGTGVKMSQKKWSDSHLKSVGPYK